jgi:fused signal recognition particle receptor
VIDPVPLVAASDVVVGLAIAVPVALVAGGIALATRRRGRTAASGDEATGGVAAAGPATPSPTPSPTPSAMRSTAAAPVTGEAPAPAEPAPAAAPEPEAEPASYRGRLGKARGLLSGYIGAVRARGSIDAATWDDLEEALIRADVGVGATDALLDDLRARVHAGEVAGPDALVDALRVDLVDMLSAGSSPLAEPGAARPATADGEPDRVVDVWLFVGVNGVGKTTTVGKVATRLTAGGTGVLLAAGDTFRAAAGEQLELWADRSGADIVRGSEGGDPSSVVFDAVQRAASKGVPLVLADTAGRLHNKINLIEELKKIRRVSDRPPGHVAEVLLVLDATTGQNGLAQAKVFLEAVDVSGVVLTKLDGTAKGGIVVAIQRELGLPVKLVGLGEGAGDLIDFDPQAFVDALF